MANETAVYTGGGRFTLPLSGVSDCWHVLGSGQYDGLIGNVQIRCSRDSSSTTVKIHDGGISSYLNNSSESASYGFSITWGLCRGGQTQLNQNSADTDNICLVNSTVIYSEVWQYETRT